MRPAPQSAKSHKKFRIPAQDKTILKASFPVVAIGASAGGLKALTELFQHLPVDTGMGFIIIQHLSPKHESMMAGILSRVTKMGVLEITDGLPVAPNQVYVMPENASLSILEGVLKVHPAGPDHSRKMPIDHFFHSLAGDCPNEAIAVILSGAATDGSLGLASIKEAGGITFAQDPETAEYNSMPQSAISTHHVDFICSPKEIALKLSAISRHSEDGRSKAETDGFTNLHDDSFVQILKLFQKTSGINFTHYKTPTVKRRAVRRMVLNKVESLKDYAALLKKNPKEVQLLLEDVLIQVTQFFRDPEMFEFLKKDVFPRLIKKRAAGAEPLRIWVAGCSTGEEAYSMAIALFDFLGDRSNDFPIQIFATDAKASCIETARKGVYAKSPSFNVSEEYLRRFFLKTGESYQIAKSVRDVCVFAKHNVLADPPYSKMDLVSCRNLLIYLDPTGQRKLLPTFHYALKPAGFLVLGKSESVGDHTDLFDPIDKKFKIYSKKAVDPKKNLAFALSPSSPEKFPVWKPKMSEAKDQDIFKEADRVILEKSGHAGVVINGDKEIVQFRGDTSPFLNNSPGTPSIHLFKMAREGLGPELHAAILKAAKTGRALQKKGIRIQCQGVLREVALEVVPLKTLSGPGYFLILFSLLPLPEDPEFTRKIERRDTKVQKPKSPGIRELEIKELKAELSATKAYLRAIIEEREAANRELRSANEESQASNEEFQSMNEELQSANEELETAQEELQATNEEITTMNDELQNRISQLTVLNDDLGNLLSSIHLPVIMVGRDLRIRRFTRVAGKVLHLIPGDIGRPLTDLKPGINFPDLEAAILDVMATASVKEREVQDKSGKWYFMQIRTYKTSDNKIDGAIILMTDINDFKRNSELLEINQVKLEMSNLELEQFAYVASHDLQEPLRMVSMYLDLLRKRYKDKLDKEAEEFIGFAKSGAERSEKMIRDLLEYARIGAKGKSPKTTAFESILKRTLSNLELDVLESGAEITHDPLPELMVDRFQMVQLFQNLLSNAMKYRGVEPLKIHISAKEQNKEWLFSIKDNGIGIAPQYKDKVFALFQRLHTKTDHPGSGIGLAVCKKIIERHGGKIWIESQPGQGAAFFFTLSEKIPQADDAGPA